MDRPAWTVEYLAARHLGGDEWLIMIPLLLGRARVAVADEHGIDGDFV